MQEDEGEVQDADGVRHATVIECVDDWAVALSRGARGAKRDLQGGGRGEEVDEENAEQESTLPQSNFVVPRGTVGRDVSNYYTYYPCAIAIVGGLGALGACVSSWFAGTRFQKIKNHVSHDIDLLGRSGRSKGWPPAVHFSCCGSISMRRFDVASRFHVLCDLPIFKGSHSCGFTLQQSDPVDMIFIHASGVLNDRIFPRQNLATFREVCSAKLSFPDISTLRNHASPRQVECVFSSVAATLANRGAASHCLFFVLSASYPSPFLFECKILFCCRHGT